MTVDDLTFDDRGLIPCVVQQYDTGEVLIVRRKDDAYVALNEEGDEVARVVPTDATWEAEINNSYRTHVDGAALIAAAEVLTQD